MNELFRRMLALPPQASSIAREIDTLHFVLISVSMLGWLAVLSASIGFVVRGRRGRGAQTASARGHTLPIWLEFAVIVGLLGGFCGVWMFGHAQYVRLRTPPDDSLDVYVVAKQWMWQFAYPDGTASQRDLVVPAQRPVRLLLTSRDVVHSFFVPPFRIKQDVVPGRMTVAWFRATRPGSYPLYCTEYCGLSHSRMLGRVIALAPANFEDWRRRGIDPDDPERSALVSNAPRPAGIGQDLVRQGERVAAEHGCLRCHTLDGTPHLGPSWAGLYRSEIPLEDGRRVTADDAYLTRSMMEPMEEVRAGFQPIMPSYLGVLSASETGALVAFIHSLEQVRGPSRALPLPYPSAAPVGVPAQVPPGEARQEPSPSLDAVTQPARESL